MPLRYPYKQFKILPINKIKTTFSLDMVWSFRIPGPLGPHLSFFRLQYLPNNITTV